MSSEQESNRPDMTTEAPGSHAFEYVTGSLRGEARQVFEELMQQDEALAREVRFWEQELMSLHQSTPERLPDSSTWAAIESAIESAEVATAEHSESHQSIGQTGLWRTLNHTLTSLFHSWQSGFVLFRPGVLALMWALLTTVWLVSAPQNPATFTPDYVAVLTQPDSDQPLLTALTSSEGAELRLQWQNGQTTEQPMSGDKPSLTIQNTAQNPIPPDASWQLWARSRRDGQIRSLLVFSHQRNTQITLDQARLRLIRDAEDLILTREEAGGSPIDEPSDELLARGACVRLTLEAS